MWRPIRSATPIRDSWSATGRPCACASPRPARLAFTARCTASPAPSPSTDLREVAIQATHADLERLRGSLAITAAPLDGQLDVTLDDLVAERCQRLDRGAGRDGFIDQRAQPAGVS